MPARKTHEDVENVYAAAERWVDAALRKDDSLFTPGKPIWSSAGLEKLRKRVLNRPDVEGSGFHGKLRTQLAESSPEVIQLMGEVLYAYFLSIWPRGNGGMKGDNKRARVNEVLAQSSEPAKVPNALADALDVGISGYGNALIQIVANVGTIIEFVEQWKEKSSPNEESLLNDPWAFKEFFEGLRFRSISNVPRAQREALFHLVFPDTFEGTVDVNAKKQIVEAKAFAHFVTEETSNVDRKIEQIRRDLEAHWGRDFDFFDEGVRKYWKPDKGEQLVEELEGLAAKSKSTLINESRTGYLPGLATQLFLPAAFLRDIETLLDDKKQVIFQGPPGTGKTYVAQRLANHLAGSPDRVTLVQFHPSYAYEDFVAGLSGPHCRMGRQASN